MKPKMLLFGGFGWSASSPLVYTLQRNAKYAHFGYTKAFEYLIPKEENLYLEFYHGLCDGTWENYKSEEPGTHRMNLSVDMQPLHDFSLSHIKKLVEGERTEKKLIDFYHALHDHVITKGYKSVGDYYLAGRGHTVDKNKFHQLLMSEFDIRVLVIVRDPVRRTFSRYLNKLQEGLSDQPLELIVKNHAKKINNLYKTFGKDRTHVTVMEELWEGDGTAKKELSQFLDHPITNLWKNLYAPDRGHLVEFDKDVPCQAFGQDLLKLTPEIYYHYRKKYDHVYQTWKQEFGSLPLHWGEPIEYKA
tara:strand:+ start:158 stop:1066 length:909 start_codon:yes stop_codon:yes gene_type:complete